MSNADLTPDKPTAATVTSTHLLNGLKRPGNRSLWVDFVDRYRPVIVSTARRMGLDADTAEDAAQQALVAFAEAYRQGKYDRTRGRLRHWLMGIARNQMLKCARARPVREVQLVGVEDRTDVFARISDSGEMESVWEVEWKQAVLRHCLEMVRSEVDANTMHAFRLFVTEEWPAKKVAEKLGMTDNAVFGAKRRVLQRMRELLPQVEEDW